MKIELNGEPRTIADDEATVTAALALLDVDSGARGVAVAVDGEVLPRGEWGRRALAPGARIEVLTAIQGG